jgi:hypothetical protein
MPVLGILDPQTNGISSCHGKFIRPHSPAWHTARKRRDRLKHRPPSIKPLAQPLHGSPVRAIARGAMPRSKPVEFEPAYLHNLR